MAESPTSLSYAGGPENTDLAANGVAVTLGSGQVVTLAGYDLAEASECQLGTGQANAPAGSTDFGFADTTYAVSTAQVLTETTLGSP